LVHGILLDDKVLSPLYGSGFNITSGALERAPARDGVPCYKVHEMNGKQYVRVTKRMVQSQVAPMVKRDYENKTKMVIIGGGAAGA
jgi:hypothetical protein